MRDNLKYIAWEGSFSIDYIIFPSNIKHIEMAFNLGLEDRAVVSAGFVEIDDGILKPYGSSTSLGIKNRMEDKVAFVMKRDSQ